MCEEAVGGSLHISCQATSSGNSPWPCRDPTEANFFDDASLKQFSTSLRLFLGSSFFPAQAVRREGEKRQVGNTAYGNGGRQQRQRRRCDKGKLDLVRPFGQAIRPTSSGYELRHRPSLHHHMLGCFPPCCPRQKECILPRPYILREPAGGTWTRKANQKRRPKIKDRKRFNLR